MAVLSPSETTPHLPPEPLSRGVLSKQARVAILVAAVAIGALVWMLLDGNITAAVLAGVGTDAVSLYVVSRIVEGRRRATDRLMATVLTATFAAILVPLVSVMWTVIDRGAARFDTAFFTETMRSVIGEGGGGAHAIMGTLVITGVATLISAPIGLFVSIYLSEYGRGPLARAVTTLVDVMSGIPSIVAGLFAYALFVVFQGPGARSGLAGGVALSVLMLPVVVRASVEMLRLVPNELREASYALGVPKWRTIVRVVLPTAAAGLLTSITLAIARVIGETAPLLLTAGLAQGMNLNPLEGRMTSLPVMAYYGYQAPGFPPEPGYDRGWTAALVLVLIVTILFSIARILAKIFQPKGLR